MNNTKTFDLPKTILLLFQFTAFFLFLGRGWQHLYLGYPYNAFFYGNHMVYFSEWILGMPFPEYLRDQTVGNHVVTFVRSLGWVYLTFAMIAVFFQYIPKWLAKIFVVSSTFLLLFLALSYYIGQAHRLGQFWEYASQFSTPLFLYYARFGQPTTPRYLFWLKVAIALTFTCHGLYAIGYYPQPGFFVDMISRGLSFPSGLSRQILYLAGILDFALSIFIFLPFRKLVIGSLVWAFIWGVITTGARLVTNIYPDIFWDTVFRNTPNMIMRFPHFMFPLIALTLVIYQMKNKNNM